MNDRDEFKQKQIKIAARLQLKWLERMETLLDEGTITSTDMATLARVLLSNGWNLDPSRLPKGLRDKLQGVELPSFDDPPNPDEFGLQEGNA